MGGVAERSTLLTLYSLDGKHTLSLFTGIAVQRTQAIYGKKKQKKKHNVMLNSFFRIDKIQSRCVMVKNLLAKR